MFFLQPIAEILWDWNLAKYQTALCGLHQRLTKILACLGLREPGFVWTNRLEVIVLTLLALTQMGLILL